MSNLKCIEEIKGEIIKNKRGSFSLIGASGINFWRFLYFTYLELDQFFTLLDIDDGTRTGWEKFVETIGLNHWEDRKWCQQYHNGRGPTRASLSRLLQKPNYDRDISLEEVLEIIKEMGRYDILYSIDWNGLIDHYSMCVEKLSPEFSKQETFPIIIEPLVDILCYEADHCSVETKTKDIVAKPNKKSGGRIPIVLLCYSEDSSSDALKIAEQLRRGDEKSGRKKIGAVLIHDKSLRKLLLTDGNNTLHKWFSQARYIVPILSPEYLKQIQNINGGQGSPLLSESSIINRMIYRNLHDQFVSFGSRNYRCRPILPERFKKEIRMHPVVCGNGLFAYSWNNDVDGIENLAMALLLKPISP